MAWVKIDDKLRSNAKWLQLRKAPEAKLLWFECLVACNESTTDGHVHHYQLDRWAFDAGITTPKRLQAATAVLVELRLWHDHETIHSCEECLEDAGGHIEPGSFYVHEYLTNQPGSDEVRDPLEKKIGRRKKQLHRNRDLCAEIRGRDHDLCRYCGIEVDFKARSGDASGTYDHINPMDFGSSTAGDNDGGNALHKIVVACRRCNGIKKRRTPDEAGMPLREAPGHSTCPPSPSWPVPGPVLAPGQEMGQNGQDSPGPGQASRAPARETGPGQDGPGTGQARARNGPGRAKAGGGAGAKAGVGAGRGGAGPGRRGPGKAGGGPSREAAAVAGADPETGEKL